MRRPSYDKDASMGGRRPQAAGHALIAGVVGLVIASLMNASSLAEVAQRQEQSAVRTVALAVTGALERASSTLLLDRPRRGIDAMLGRGRTDTVTTVTEARGRPAPRPTPRPLAQVPPTAASPADAWIIGDSFVELFGPKLMDELVTTGAVQAEVDFRFISGLSRPDFFDWPSHIRQRMRTNPPDIVAAMFGGNDAQPVTVNGVHYEKFSSEWWDLYTERVEEVMDAMHGASVAYWVGLPIMKDPDFTRTAIRFNDVYRRAASQRPWMRYVSSWEVFTDERGRYADYLPNHRGTLRLMRYEDGAHFTPSGALMLAVHVAEVIGREWQLPDP